jgi:hypothetical protein
MEEAEFENEVDEEMAETGVDSQVRVDPLLPLPRLQSRMRSEVILRCPSVILLRPIESCC